jgi:hypothetical protein
MVGPHQIKLEHTGRYANSEEPCPCPRQGRDRYIDLRVSVFTRPVVAALGFPDPGEEVEVTVSGLLWNGTPFEGSDCAVIREPGLSPLPVAGPELRLVSLTQPTETMQAVAFTLPEQAEVRLQVFDITGREVKDIVRAVLDEGIHQVEWDTRGLASGLYLYRLHAGGETLRSKVTIVH